jgi:hypothetical protein
VKSRVLDVESKFTDSKLNGWFRNDSAEHVAFVLDEERDSKI